LYAPRFMCQRDLGRGS